MGDALLEHRGGSDFGIDMHRVGVTADGGEHQNIRLADGLAEAGGHAHGKVFEEHRLAPVLLASL